MLVYLVSHAFPVAREAQDLLCFLLLLGILCNLSHLSVPYLNEVENNVA